MQVVLILQKKILKAHLIDRLMDLYSIQMICLNLKIQLKEAQKIYLGPGLVPRDLEPWVIAISKNNFVSSEIEKWREISVQSPAATPQPLLMRHFQRLSISWPNMKENDLNLKLFL